MPWNTSEGTRVLKGAEARLFAVAIPTMIDFYDDDFDFDLPKKLNYGFRLIQGRFENLSNEQKFAVLEEVAESLLTNKSEDEPEQDEYNEGAIYYVYCWLKSQFDDIELGLEIWAKYILDAYNECFPIEDNDEESNIPRISIECVDKSAWDDAIEQLADRILWDRDFEMYPDFDMSTQTAAPMLEMMGITSSYFLPSKLRSFPNIRGAKERLYALTSSIAHSPEVKVSQASSAIPLPTLQIKEEEEDERRPTKKQKK